VSKQAANGHFTGCASTAAAFALALDVRFVAFNFAATGAFEFTLTSQAAADDLTNAFCAVAVDVHRFSCTGSGHFQGEVFD
jgi:hypothetical protein